MAGPLRGLKVVELAGIGPGPMAGMLLANLGAEVIQIERPGSAEIGIEMPPEFELFNRGKEKLSLDLKDPAAIEALLGLLEQADVLIEGYRPGVLERLGLSPAVCHARNPRLVIGRMTGWGNQGIMAKSAGHDLNYIALSGVLAAIGARDGKPAIPHNLVGDFGGGSLYLVFGIMSALFERQTSGRGQVVDAAMIDGVASLTTSMFAQHAAGLMNLDRASNLLDGGTPYYDVYRCADGQWLSVAPLEPKFFALLIKTLGLDAGWIARQHDRAAWPELRTVFTECFAQRTRDEWSALLGHLDVCVAPVLNLDEAPHHAHHASRGTYAVIPAGSNSMLAPAPAPRFDRTPAAAALVTIDQPDPGATLRRWGVAEQAIQFALLT